MSCVLIVIGSLDNTPGNQISQEEVDLALFDPNYKSLPASYPPRLRVTIKPGAQATDSECVLPVRGLLEDLSFPMALSLSARSPYAMHDIFQGKNYIESIPHPPHELISLFRFIHKARGYSALISFLT